MTDYVSLKDIPKYFGLEKGDSVWLSSDIKSLLYSCIEHGDSRDMNVLIDGIIGEIGPEGTLLIPTFNWDFCKGKTFDIRTTPCKTGVIGKTALKRDDFKRTQHPIYSFAVWGKDADYLCSLTNKSSFGADSPFSYCKDVNAKNVFIDVECQHSFTFVHYVEEQVGVCYRYLKDFTAPYIDGAGNESIRTYSMNVRDLDMDVFVTIYPLEEEFREAGLSRRYTVNDIPMKTIEIGGTYDIIARDARENRSRKICTFIGQEE
ncbi:MAG: AAC(3) family N-acetyltransferase [Lachnospiraceae bacterium]|nr:AAC(3) family N-acetyltransferase [Lachnospiraceae bacterium]